MLLYWTVGYLYIWCQFMHIPRTWYDEKAAMKPQMKQLCNQTLVSQPDGPPEVWFAKPAIAGLAQGLGIDLDYLTISLHILKGMQLHTVWAVLRGCQWPMKNGGFSTGYLSSKSISDWGNPNLHLDQPITKRWCPLETMSNTSLTFLMPPD